MSLIPLLSPADAPKDTQIVYEEFHRRMSFPSPPNFIMTQGHSPTVARGTWELVRNILVSGELPRWTKEMMFVAISIARNCRYCIAAHVACCRMLGVNMETLNDLVRDVNAISDPRLRSIILFSLKSARSPQELSESDFEDLRGHGLKQSEIIEVIAMSALAVYANIVADATKMDEDEMFATN